MSERVNAACPSTPKVAVLTESISHFEVPLFRLCAADPRIEIKVFHVEPVAQTFYDSQYAQTIDWGEDMLAGYESEQGESAADLDRRARAWGADVILMNGYAWQGAPALAFRNWRTGHRQIHRGTLNYYLDPRRPVKGRLMRPLRDLLLRLFHAHHYGGSYSRRVLEMAGVRDEAMFMVPYSVDTGYFVERADAATTLTDAAAVRGAAGWAPDDRVILFIAQHNWFKGPDIAMEVFRSWQAQDPKARFLVVGSGSMTDSLRKYAEEHLPAGSCHFSGFVPSKDTAKYYVASDLVICTSRYETWARMINEAMLCRRPCVINHVVPAAGGLVDDRRNGYVVPPEVDRYVAAIIDFFARSDTQREEMRSAARLRALEFAYENHMEEFVACVRYALTRGKRRAPAST